MPYIKPSETKRIPLKSDPNYWVDWRSSVRYGDMRAASRAAFKTTGDGDGEIDATAYADAMLLAYIAGWNLDDEQGNILPVTVENLGFLTSEDSNQLASLLQEDQKQVDKRRKR